MKQNKKNTNKLLRVCITDWKSSVSSNSPVALIFIPVANLLLYRLIVSTTGQFTCNIKGPSNILSRNRCYGLQPLLTGLWTVRNLTLASLKLWNSLGSTLSHLTADYNVRDLMWFPLTTVLFYWKGFRNQDVTFEKGQANIKTFFSSN